VAAEKLDDVSSGIARAMALAGMPQSHARTVLANAGSSVSLEWVGRTRPERGAGNGTHPGSLASAPPTLFTGRPIALIHSGAPFRVPFSS